MARYYGFSHDDLLSMDCQWFNMYYRAITVIEAQEELVGMQRVSYPHLKNKNRKDLHKKYSSLAYPHEKKKFISPKELMKELGALNG